MEWCQIRARNDGIISPSLFRLPNAALICSWCEIPLLPRGTYATSGDLVRYGWLGGTNDPEAVYLNAADLTGLYPTGPWQGCCRPNGDLPNLESQDGTPLAYGFSDCWNSHYVWIPSDWHRREPMDGGTPVVRVAVARFASRDRVIERAGGPDMLTANERLQEEAKANIRRWIRSASAANKLFARIRVCSMEEAWSTLTQTGCVNWLTTSAV